MEYLRAPRLTDTADEISRISVFPVQVGKRLQEDGSGDRSHYRELLRERQNVPHRANVFLSTGMGR